MVFMAEAFFSGCISKAINDGKDYSWAKIKSVLNDKNNSSLSTKIYRVIEKTLNIVTCNKLKDTDVLFDAIETIFNEFKDNENSIDAVKCGLRVLGSDDSVVSIESFLEKFYDGICQDDDLYKRISLILQEKGIEINRDGFQRINEKIDSLYEKISSKNSDEHNFQKREPVKSRTQEYADKWNANMFLNDFDKRDEVVGVNVKLREVYLKEHLPCYIWKNDNKQLDDLQVFLSEYIVDYIKNRMLVIFGQPGIGKTTLITWIIANFNNSIDKFLVYRFAPDLKKVNWENLENNNEVIYEVFRVLNLSYDKLEGKILLLDGFDEINVGKKREKIINQLYWGLMSCNELKNLSLIITCRENYVSDMKRVECDYITLQPWSDRQILSFCEIYQGKTNCNITEKTIENIIENRSVFGIPIILYMVLALNISIDNEEYILDVYDKIFALEGGIYDRCLQNKRYGFPHRIQEIKIQIHQVSREIAMWMFENKPEEACIHHEIYQEICKAIMSTEGHKDEIINQDILIGNYFKLVRHCEGMETEELSFIHRTIYEYFVVENIYSYVEKFLCKLDDESQVKLANISIFLKQGKITNTIGEYLTYKIKKCYYNLHKEMQEKFYRWWEECVCKMMSLGMFYYTRLELWGNKDIIFKEVRCFVNLLDILRRLFDTSKQKYIMENVERTYLEKYIKHSIAEFSIRKEAVQSELLDLNKVSLEEIDLEGIDLTRVSFINSNMQGANLRKANLEGTNLNRANLYGADLSEANLYGAYLSEAKLEKVKLMGANLRKAMLKGANLQEANLQGVDLREADIREVNMLRAYVEKSIWLEDDILTLVPELRNANFKFIIVESQTIQRLVGRGEIFCNDIS